MLTVIKRAWYFKGNTIYSLTFNGRHSMYDIQWLTFNVLTLILTFNHLDLKMERIGHSIRHSPSLDPQKQSTRKRILCRRMNMCVRVFWKMVDPPQIRRTNKSFYSPRHGCHMPLLTSPKQTESPEHQWIFVGSMHRWLATSACNRQLTIRPGYL